MTDAFKSFSQIPDPKGDQRDERVESRPLPPQPYHQRREKVVDGTIKWKPIDQTAARVVAPAKWWAKPPEPSPNMSKKPAEFEEVGRIRHKVVVDPATGKREELLNLNDVEVVAVSEHEHQAKKIMENAASMEARARDIHDSLDYLLTNIGPLFDSVNKELTTDLASLREKRFAIDTESRLLLNQLKDVRQFFLDASHETQIDRLRDFVDLCERLQALKESGFLDNIADTILKLS